MLSQQSKRLFELVENLLDLSRLEADSIRISPTEIEGPRAPGGDRRRRLRRSQGGGIEVPAGLRAVVDVQAFDRILTNLLANAVRMGRRLLRLRPQDERRALGHDRRSRSRRRRRIRRQPLRAFTLGATPSSEGAAWVSRSRSRTPARTGARRPTSRPSPRSEVPSHPARRARLTWGLRETRSGSCRAE